MLKTRSAWYVCGGYCRYCHHHHRPQHHTVCLAAATANTTHHCLAAAASADDGQASSGMLPCSANELIQWCRTRLAHYKVPAKVQIMDSLPTTVSGSGDRVVGSLPTG